MLQHSVKGSEVADELMQQLCDLRLSIVQLKANIDPQEDFKKFTIFVQKSQYVDYVIDNGKIQAFFVLYYSQQQINNRKSIVLEPEFGFVSPQYRKSSFVQKAFGRIIKRLKLRYWYKPIYIVGCAYPHSFISFMKQFKGNLWTLGSQDIPAYPKAILTNFLQRKIGSFTTTSGIVEVPTLHNERTDEHLQRLNKSVYYQQYIQQNPHWVNGFTLAFITKISWFSLLKTVLKSKH